MKEIQTTTLTGHKDDINDIHFSADGKRLITASSDGSLKVSRSEPECSCAP
jgi:WD40 repeat protein